MNHPGFFDRNGPFSLAEIAAHSGCGTPPDAASVTIADVLPLDAALPSHLSFLDNPRYLTQLASTRAGACFVSARYADRVPPGTHALVTPDPYRAYAMALALFYPGAAQPDALGARETYVAAPDGGAGFAAAAPQIGREYGAGGSAIALDAGSGPDGANVPGAAVARSAAAVSAVPGQRASAGVVQAAGVDDATASAPDAHPLASAPDEAAGAQWIARGPADSPPATNATNAARPAAPPPAHPPGAVAHVDPTAILEPGCIVEPGAVIGPEAQIGAHTRIGAGAVIGRRVTIGRRCAIGARAVITNALIGNAVIIHPGAAIGQDGFGFAMSPRGHLKVPQIGRVIIQDNVEIGANTTIDRGALRDTIIGEGTKIDNLVQIGHNVVIGRHCVIVAQVGISGSTVLEDFVVMGGQAGCVGHITIGAGAQIAGNSGLATSVPRGERWGGSPARPFKVWARETALLKRLAEKLSGKQLRDMTGL